jgi:diguanylate cyclase (GGDEF)-like protein
MISESRLSRLDSKVFVIAITLTGFLLVMAIMGYFSYQRQLSIARAAGNELSRLIESDLQHNENFSDAVSMLYMRLKRGESGSVHVRQEFDRDSGIYGINLYADKPNNALEGTLQSVTPLTEDALLIAESIDMALKIENKDSRYSKMERRYFFSGDNHFIYITNKMPLSRFVFQHNNGKSHSMFTTPQSGVWLSQKLRAAPVTRNNAVTHVYIDSISNAPVITVRHPVWSRTKGGVVLGWLCFDYQQSELQEIVRSLGVSAQNNFLNVYLLDKQTNTEFRIAGKSSDGKETQVSINDRYDVIVTINTLRYYVTQKGRNDLMVLLLVALCFLAAYMICCNIIRAARERAQRDPLTGLYNRSWLHKLDQRKTKDNMTVVMIDCNNFKVINDTHGHAVGDSLLKHIGQLLRARLNSNSDYAVRMGGDEFLLVFEGSNLSQVRACMKRIESDIAMSSAKIPLTVSYGVTEVARGMSIYTAIALADTLMHNAKKDAKNPDA